MMKLVVVLALFTAVVLARPQAPVDVVEYTNENDGTGNYNYRYSLSDGTKRDETGTLKEVQGDDGPAQIVVMTGSYEFVDDKGVVHKVTYTADETGFHPKVEN
ncbi:hypothetical protein ACFFRR_002410 [Megaselia abdita]